MSFFWLSKFGWLVAQPVSFCLFVALSALVASLFGARAGRAIALVAILALLAMMLSPAGRLLLAPLEARFPRPAAEAPAPYGVIVLGGAINDALTRRHGEVEFDEAAARVTVAARLARAYPDARIFYTGGSADPAVTDSREAEEARDLLVTLGVARERIGIEKRSRNTDENARFSAAILQPRPGQIWWLVTSAYHMPRAMGLFRKAGFDVVAYPVDYRTYEDERDYAFNAPSLGALVLFERAAHEWIGLTSYFLAGKIDHWFPAP